MLALTCHEPPRSGSRARPASCDRLFGWVRLIGRVRRRASRRAACSPVLTQGAASPGGRGEEGKGAAESRACSPGVAARRHIDLGSWPWGATKGARRRSCRSGAEQCPRGRSHSRSTRARRRTRPAPVSRRVRHDRRNLPKVVAARLDIHAVAPSHVARRAGCARTRSRTARLNRRAPARFPWPSPRRADRTPCDERTLGWRAAEGARSRKGAGAAIPLRARRARASGGFGEPGSPPYPEPPRSSHARGRGTPASNAEPTQ